VLLLVTWSVDFKLLVLSRKSYLWCGVQAEVDQLKQQLEDAQQHKEEELQTLKISEAGLQERLAAMGAEADDLRDQLRSSAQDLQVHICLLLHLTDAQRLPITPCLAVMWLV
jgi:septal ring factor EnvC (AmiA/AmiB activator)